MMPTVLMLKLEVDTLTAKVSTAPTAIRIRLTPNPISTSFER
jgi:hypothetical protein